MINVETNTLF